MADMPMPDTMMSSAEVWFLDMAEITGPEKHHRHRQQQQQQQQQPVATIAVITVVSAALLQNWTMIAFAILHSRWPVNHHWSTNPP